MMTIQELIDKSGFEVLTSGEDMSREIKKIFCCDLLSMAMGKAPADCAWVTVMGNINTLAVASLTDTSCLIMAEGASLDAPAKEKALQQKITVLRTDDPVFEAALRIHELANA